ncbi:2-oxoacid dehydrogenases acyltransferase-domain-containing protein [Mycena rebaudengoi]|nr:2-oxoacid dehydrogenases acyltransferase-domain-containing protein [Mycena rebaudengoi]
MRVVHRTPPPYAITGTTTTATSVLVQATYSPSSTSYPTTSTSSTAAYPSSAYPSSTYPTSTYPATTHSSNSAPCSSSRPPPPPPPTTLKAQELTPPPPPPARRLHPLDPAFSGDKRGAAVSDVDTLVTPSVRHYARTQGVDLAQIAPGTGRVERADVDAFLAAGASPSEGSAPSAPRNEKDVLVELGRTRQAMWRAMEKVSASKSPTLATPPRSTSRPPPAPQREHPCALPPFLLQLLHRHLARPPLPRRTIRSLPRAHPPHPRRPRRRALHPPHPPPLPPQISCPRHDGPAPLPRLHRPRPLPLPLTPPTPKSTSRHLTIRPHADIALALSMPSGLYTPVLRAVNTRTPYVLASQIAELAALGRAVPPALTPKHLAGGATLTVSNVGCAGCGRWASPVLVPGGGVAIVALGRAEWVWDVSGGCPRVRAEGGDTGYEYAAQGQRRLKLNVSWAADHRVVEGAEMAAFVESWRGWVEAPGRALGEGV